MRTLLGIRTWKVFLRGKKRWGWVGGNRGQNTYLLFDLNVMLPFQNKGDGLHNLLSMSTHYFIYMLQNNGKSLLSGEQRKRP